MGRNLKANTDPEKQELWTITCPDRFCKAELPFPEWMEQGFFRCPKCGMLCCLLVSDKKVSLYSMGVYVRW